MDSLTVVGSKKSCGGLPMSLNHYDQVRSNGI